MQQSNVAAQGGAAWDHTSAAAVGIGAMTLQRDYDGSNNSFMAVRGPLTVPEWGRGEREVWQE